MANWNNPINTTAYTDVLANLRDRDISAISLTDAGSDTNLPTGARRYNATTDKWQSWNGSSWVNLPFHTTIDNHIADTAIHAPFPPGMMAPYGGSSAPSGWLLCDGSAVSRATYAALFAILGTAYGVGDGSTTFNLPDFRKRLAIGRDSGTAAIDTLGKTTGSFDHTHTQPTHTHTIASHTHDMGNHTHSTPNHAHAVEGHTHSIPAHYHATTGNGADIAISSSGSHSHTVLRRGSAGTTSGVNRVSMPGSTGSDDAGGDTGSSSHSHNNASFTGRVGNVSSTINGDAAMTSGTSTAHNTTNGGGGTSGTPSTNTTSGSGVLNTSASGNDATGSNNPPVLVVNYIIKT